MLPDKRPLSTFHLHLGQKLRRKIALTKTLTDPNLLFCLAKEIAIEMYVDQKCTSFFFSCHSPALFESREMNKRN